jgi:hypothetical protein
MAGTTLNLSMRPREFSEVIGLEEQVVALRNKIATGNIPRSFLFSGPFGCGKTTLSYLVAREIQGWDFTGTPQVQEINAANITGIDGMRKLAESAGNYPMVGKYGVIILDEAHKLSKPAQELLLKEFEVPKSPTVWIICTTDPEKLIEGIRAGRCFTLQVRGMGDKETKELIDRAARELNHEGEYFDFVDAVRKSKVFSPRKILMAFEAYHSGIPAGQAISAMHFEALPEYFELAMGVVFGQWEKGYILPWIKEKDGSPKQFKSVADQIKALDDRLKKKPSNETAAPAPNDDGDVVEEEDVQGRPEVARALRAIVAASLKNQVYKGGAKSVKAADALFILSHCTSPNAFDTGMEFAATIGGLYRVNQKMTAAK